MTAIRQWEYAVIRLGQFELAPPGEWATLPGFEVSVKEQLDEMGTEGWELASVDLPFAFLKRPN